MTKNAPSCIKNFRISNITAKLLYDSLVSSSKSIWECKTSWNLTNIISEKFCKYKRIEWMETYFRWQTDLIRDMIRYFISPDVSAELHRPWSRELMSKSKSKSKGFYFEEAFSGTFKTLLTLVARFQNVILMEKNRQETP